MGSCPVLKWKIIHAVSFQPLPPHSSNDFFSFCILRYFCQIVHIFPLFLFIFLPSFFLSLSFIFFWFSCGLLLIQAGWQAILPMAYSLLLSNPFLQLSPNYPFVQMISPGTGMHAWVNTHTHLSLEHRPTYWWSNNMLLLLFFSQLTSLSVGQRRSRVSLSTNF